MDACVMSAVVTPVPDVAILPARASAGLCTNVMEPQRVRAVSISATA